MFGTTRFQIAIYAAIAAVLLLVGFNSIKAQPSRSGGAASFSSGGPSASDSEPGKDGPAEGFAMTADTSRLVVDVSGGVRRPGVYRLNQGDRVIDAIARAGGVTGQALPGAINRAAKLADGQQVVVPVTASATAGKVSGARSGAAVSASGATDAPISLGSATAAQLEEIEGIGPVTAAQILEYRDSKGGLGSIDELDQVSGIGPVTMEALRTSLQP